MDTRRCYRIADRLHAGLQRTLGQGIDRQRMVTQPLYARDVLLVCEAMRGSDLAQMAAQFRIAVAAPESARKAAGAPSPARDAAGFSPSRFLNSLFGPVSDLDGGPADPAAPPKRSGWFGRSGSAGK